MHAFVLTGLLSAKRDRCSLISNYQIVCWLILGIAVIESQCFFPFFHSLQNILYIRTLYTSILFKHFILFNQRSSDEREKQNIQLLVI